MHAKKNIFIKLLVIASISTTLPASAQNHLLIPYKKANHWGLCDTSGKMIVPATFDSLCQFYLVDNYKAHCKVPCAVFSNGKTITVYKENKMVLQSNQYDSVKIVTYKNDTYLLYKNGLVGLHKDGKKRLDCILIKRDKKASKANLEPFNPRFACGPISSDIPRITYFTSGSE